MACCSTDACSKCACGWRCNAKMSQVIRRGQNRNLLSRGTAAPFADQGYRAPGLADARPIIEGPASARKTCPKAAKGRTRSQMIVAMAKHGHGHGAGNAPTMRALIQAAHFAQTWRIQFCGVALSCQTTGGAKAMLTLLLIIVILLLFGGGGGYCGRRAGWGPRGVGGLVVTVLIVILLIWVVNELLMPPIPMPEGVPSIIR